jgi:hypothetical protein
MVTRAHSKHDVFSPGLIGHVFGMNPRHVHHDVISVVNRKLAQHVTAGAREALPR